MASKHLATQNESVIGPALERIEDGFLIASKVAPGAAVTGGGSGFRREQVLQACRDSLERLGRDHLDIYFLHWPDDSGVPLEETWGAMAELADEGLVRAIGLSNYSLEDVERCHAERPVDAVQVGLNLVDYLADRPSIAGCVRRTGPGGGSCSRWKPCRDLDIRVAASDHGDHARRRDARLRSRHGHLGRHVRATRTHGSHHRFPTCVVRPLRPGTDELSRRVVELEELAHFG